MRKITIRFSGVVVVTADDSTSILDIKNNTELVCDNDFGTLEDFDFASFEVIDSK